MKQLCPAKINLNLSLLSKLDDGYHEIKTLITELNIGDYLTINKSDKDSFSSSLDLIKEDNLITRALYLLRKIKDVPPISIHLEKIIPVAGGMGGGSSDAAIFLRMINKLYNLNLSESEFRDLAYELGMDVFYFLKGGLCLAENKGDKITEIKDKEKANAIVCYDIPSLSNEVYKNVRLSDLNRGKRNDLEDVALRINDDLAKFSNHLKGIDKDFLLSGAGGSFYLIGERDYLNSIIGRIDASFKEIVELYIPKR